MQVSRQGIAQGIASIMLGLSLAGCGGGSSAPLDDFPDVADTRQMLDRSFDCAWALDYGLPACVRSASGDRLQAATGDVLVTVLLGPPASDDAPKLQLKQDLPEDERIRDIIAQMDQHSVTGLQFKLENLPAERMKDFVTTHFRFTGEEVDSIVGEFNRFQQALESGDHNNAMQMATQGADRPAAVNGKLRLAAGGSHIILQRLPD